MVVTVGGGGAPYEYNWVCRMEITAVSHGSNDYLGLAPRTIPISKPAPSFIVGPGTYSDGFVEMADHAVSASEWVASALTQAVQPTLTLELNGVRANVSQWAALLKTKEDVLWSRIRDRKSVKEILGQ
jgi:hypothetical protein